ncbi:MAG: hypothetical protein PHO08_10020 [Methylococcales bacterium]|nr:hypothetical protein [Methylococcales bacterium]
MKYFLIVTTISLFVAACTEKQPDSATTQTPTLIKATTVRPITIPSTLDSVFTCSLDSVNGQPSQETVTITDKSKISLSGWATDEDIIPKVMFIELEGPGKVYLEASRGGKRPDVAAHLNKPGLVDAGWASYADLSGVVAGTYKLRIIQVEGQSGSICTPNSKIVIN